MAEPTDPSRGDARALAVLSACAAGREVPVHPAGPGDPLAWTDGTAIHLGHDTGVAPDLAVLVQAALLRAGSLSLPVVLRLAGRRRLAERYLAIEAPRALNALRDRLPRRLLAHPALHRAVPPSGSAAHSLRLALRNRAPDAADPLSARSARPSCCATCAPA